MPSQSARLFIRVLPVALATVFALAACSPAEKPARSWEVAAQGIYGGALSADADMTIVGSMNHGASLWKTFEHERLYNWSHEAGEFTELVAASFSPDGSRAVTTDPRTLVMWDTNTGRGLQYWGTPGSVLDVAVFPDNRHVLLGLDDHSSLVFDAQTGAYQQTLLHNGEVGAVDISADGTLALTGSDDFTAVLWRLNGTEKLYTFQHDNPVRVAVLSPDARYSFTAAQGDLVALWNNETGNLVAELHNEINHGVLSASFSADGQHLVVGYTNRQIVMYNVTDGRVLKRWNPGLRHTMRASGAAILEVAFERQGRSVLALTGDGRLLELRIS